MLEFCDPMDCSQPGSSVCEISHKNTRAGCHFLLQGIFPTQGSNLQLPHWQVVSLPLSHLGSPKYHMTSLVVESKKEMIQINLLPKQKETPRLREQTYGCQEEGWGERIAMEFGMDMYTLLD